MMRIENRQYLSQDKILEIHDLLSEFPEARRVSIMMHLPLGREMGIPGRSHFVSRYAGKWRLRPHIREQLNSRWPAIRFSPRVCFGDEWGLLKSHRGGA